MPVDGFPELDHWIVVLRRCAVSLDAVSRPPRTWEPHPLRRFGVAVRVVSLQASLEIGRGGVSHCGPVSRKGSGR
eukprot:6688737-Heterocapsa_arctica.AAC.1